MLIMDWLTGAPSAVTSTPGAWQFGEFGELLSSVIKPWKHARLKRDGRACIWQPDQDIYPRPHIDEALGLLEDYFRMCQEAINRGGPVAASVWPLQIRERWTSYGDGKEGYFSYEVGMIEDGKTEFVFRSMRRALVCMIHCMCLTHDMDWKGSEFSSNYRNLMDAMRSRVIGRLRGWSEPTSAGATKARLDSLVKKIMKEAESVVKDAEKDLSGPRHNGPMTDFEKSQIQTVVSAGIIAGADDIARDVMSSMGEDLDDFLDDFLGSDTNPMFGFRLKF